MKPLNRALAPLASFAPVIVRVILGGLFVLHGIDKFDTGLSNVEGFFDSQGVPLPALTAPLTAIAEIVLGAALIFGFATRLAAIGLGLIMVGAIIWVKNSAIIGGAEQELAYLSGLIAVALLGPGRFSVDEAINADDTVIDLRSARPAETRVGAQL